MNQFKQKGTEKTKLRPNVGVARRSARAAHVNLRQFK
jgi:hypothetical protein